MKTPFRPFLLLAAGLVPVLPAYGQAVSEIYTLSGPKDPTFEEIVEKQGVVAADGKRSLPADATILGTKVTVNREYLEEGIGRVSNPRDIEKTKFHTALGTIRGDVAEKHTRWYQVDGKTQIFRLFKGDKNGDLGKACRIETFTPNLSLKSRVIVWEGSYCVPNTGSGAIAFQLWIQGGKANEGKISYPFVSLRAGSDYIFNHTSVDLQKPWRGVRQYNFLKDAAGQRVALRFRYDGKFYELSRKMPDGSYEVIDGATLRAPEGMGAAFRWGAYIGQSPNGVTGDKLILVTGAKVYSERGSIKPPSWVAATEH